MMERCAAGLLAMATYEASLLDWCARPVGGRKKNKTCHARKINRAS